MPKRSTDLLEVFRGPREGGGASTSQRKTRGPKKPKAKAKRSGFDGVFLSPRQMLLAACVVVLLLVLSFTVGVGMGRRGTSTTGGTPELQRNVAQEAWWIRGQLARHRFRDGVAVEPVGIVSDLVQLYGFKRSQLRVEEGPVEYWWISYGPFRTEADAERELEQRELGVMKVQGGFPFSFARVVRDRR